MFERPWHRQILRVLQALRAPLLAEHGFYFAGGTRIVLDLGEYRESRDLDFLCSDPAGYARLRSAAREEGFAALFTTQGLEELHFPREIRTDQYGIRFPVGLGETLFKVELVREGRISLACGEQPAWAPVECLTREDCYTEKLLANSDRWPDRQVLSRDLVDLAAMCAHWGTIPTGAWDKAQAAYQTAIRKDLAKALAAWSADAEYRKRCLEGLSVEENTWLRTGLDLLRRNL